MDRTEASDAFNAGSIPVGCIFAIFRELFITRSEEKKVSRLIEERKRNDEKKPDIQDMKDFSVKDGGAGRKTPSAWKEIGRILKGNTKSLALVIAAAAVLLYRHYHGENQRLTQNQEALAADLTHYRTRAGEEAASAQVLRLRCAEFERLRAADAEEIRRLGIRIRRLESTARIASASQSEFRAPLRDTLILRNPAAVPTDIPLSDRIGPPHNLPDPHDTAALHRTLFPPLYDTLRHFRWQDPWVRVEGIIRRDSVQCRICSVDTLRQIVHRIPHRFLFIRWGTKALRQEIVSQNPHTRIVYTEYIRIER